MSLVIQIVILAMIAVFLILRLYSVLGQRPEGGHEHGGDTPDNRPVARQVSANSTDHGAAGDSRPLVPNKTGGRSGEAAAGHIDFVEPRAEAGLRKIMAADRRFDTMQFIEGARAAYAMILTAFWEGDRASLRELTDGAVYDGFVGEIDARELASETNQSSLIRINDSQITDASFDAPIARITLRFDADISSITRDKDGTAIAGSLDDAIQINDLWTFRRDIGSPSPDWLLEETDEG